MKKIEKLKLNKLSQDELKKRELNNIRGGMMTAAAVVAVTNLKGVHQLPQTGMLTELQVIQAQLVVMMWLVELLHQFPQERIVSLCTFQIHEWPV